MTFAPQINPFWLFGNGLVGVGDGSKISNENFRYGRPRFHATSHLKIGATLYIL